MKMGVYQIVNKINGARYIGSSINLTKRKSNHFYDLRNNVHKNKWLQKSFNLYGEENFKFEILILCEKNELKSYEQKVINSYDLDLDLFNIEPNSENSTGVKKTEKAKKLISEKKKNPTDETREKLRRAVLGKKQSEETKRKRSESLKLAYKEGRRTITEQQRKRMSLCGKSNYGLRLGENKNAKKVQRINVETKEIINSWNSLTEASIEIGMSLSYLSRLCNQKKKGFEFVEK